MPRWTYDDDDGILQMLFRCPLSLSRLRFDITAYQSLNLHVLQTSSVFLTHFTSFNVIVFYLFYVLHNMISLWFIMGVIIIRTLCITSYRKIHFFYSSSPFWWGSDWGNSKDETCSFFWIPGCTYSLMSLKRMHIFKNDREFSVDCQLWTTDIGIYDGTWPLM